VICAFLLAFSTSSFWKGPRPGQFHHRSISRCLGIPPVSSKDPNAKVPLPFARSPGLTERYQAPVLAAFETRPSPGTGPRACLTPVSHCLERIASGRYKPWFRRSESSPWHSVASVAQDGGKHSNWSFKSWPVFLFLFLSLSLSSAFLLLDPCKCNATARRCLDT
jgi:hypothetical protein